MPGSLTLKYEIRPQREAVCSISTEGVDRLRSIIDLSYPNLVDQSFVLHHDFIENKLLLIREHNNEITLPKDAATRVMEINNCNNRKFLKGILRITSKPSEI